MKTHRLALCFALLAPAPLAAHPHVYIDTALTLVADAAGRVSGIEVSWTYDEFYTLLLLEDMGLDPDGDGVLTPAELDQLSGFDQKWIEGFQGDTYIWQGDQALALSAPENRGTSFDNGKITSRHFRTIDAPPGEVRIKAFDPTFYSAYDLSGRVTVPQNCKLDIKAADLDAAYTLVEEALYVNPPKEDDDYPEVGEAFADEVRVACE